MAKQLAERLEVMRRSSVEILENARKNAEIEILELQTELAALRQEFETVRNTPGKPGRVQKKLKNWLKQPVSR